jgi:single-strand DNA-binding protein
MQRIVLIGRLGKDAETKTVSNQQVANFSVAVDSGKAPNKTTTWYDCTIWLDTAKHLANVVQYLRKGGQVYIEGTPKARAYTNNQQQTVATISVSVNMVTLLGDKADNQNAPASDGKDPEGFTTAVAAQPAQTVHQPANGAAADMPAGLPTDGDLPW